MKKVVEAAKEEQKKPGDVANKRGGYEEGKLAQEAGQQGGAGGRSAAGKAIEDYRAQRAANQALRQGQNRHIQTDRVGVNLSEQFGCLKNQSCLSPRASQMVRGRNCVEYGGVWIDEGFEEKTPTLVVKTMSDAYFRILERQPQVKEVFQLGNYLVWLTPSGTALVLDMNDGKDKLSDAEIDKLFASK
jgi:Ca-activated chloride channel family protein